jgi:hypothetical protein
MKIRRAAEEGLSMLGDQPRFRRRPLRLGKRVATATLLALALPVIGAHAANTVPSRTFTSEWECDNGRKVLFNAHPLRPKEEAWVTYIGNRAQVAVSAKNPDRFASKDEKVAWEMHGESATLVFRDLLPEPLKCKRIKKP